MAIGAIGAGLKIASGILGTKGGGSRAGRIRRQQKEVAAKQSVAAAQRKAFEEKRQAELLASRALAVAAAGGGGADDQTVSKIIADIKGEGAYRAAIAMYEGEEEARTLRFEGRMLEMEEKAEREARKSKKLGTILETGASLLEEYG